MRISDWSSDVCSSDLSSSGLPTASAGCARRWTTRGEDALPNTSPERGAGPFGNAEWWRGGRHERIVRVKNPSTKPRSEEHTSELQSLMSISYAVFCLNKQNLNHNKNDDQLHCV